VTGWSASSTSMILDASFEDDPARGRACRSRSRRVPSDGSLRKRSDVSMIIIVAIIDTSLPTGERRRDRAVGGSSPPVSIRLPAPTVNRALSSRYDGPDQHRRRDQHRHDHHDSRDVGSRAGLRDLVGGGTMEGAIVEMMIKKSAKRPKRSRHWRRKSKAIRSRTD
jgi:hypothetical protein